MCEHIVPVFGCEDCIKKSVPRCKHDLTGPCEDCEIEAEENAEDNKPPRL